MEKSKDERVGDLFLLDLRRNGYETKPFPGYSCGIYNSDHFLGLYAPTEKRVYPSTFLNSDMTILEIMTKHGIKIG